MPTRLYTLLLLTLLLAFAAYITTAIVLPPELFYDLLMRAGAALTFLPVLAYFGAIFLVLWRLLS